LSFTILVAILWTHSNNLMSFLYVSAQYSRWDHTSAV